MISTTFMKNKAVEDIISESIKDAKLSKQKARRDWVRKMLDYYGGNYTSQYIKEYFNSTERNIDVSYSPAICKCIY